MGSTTVCPVHIFPPPTELLVCYQPHRQKVMPGQKSINETFLVKSLHNLVLIYHAEMWEMFLCLSLLSMTRSTTTIKTSGLKNFHFFGSRQVKISFVKFSLWNRFALAFSLMISITFLKHKAFTFYISGLFSFLLAEWNQSRFMFWNMRNKGPSIIYKVCLYSFFLKVSETTPLFFSKSLLMSKLAHSSTSASVFSNQSV